MIRTLGKVYKTSSLKTVLEALDLKDEASLVSFASKIMISTSEGDENETCIVEKVEDGFVVFASCVENSKRAGSAFKEGVGYGDIAKMMMESKIRRPGVAMCGCELCWLLVEVPPATELSTVEPATGFFMTTSVASGGLFFPLSLA